MQPINPMASAEPIRLQKFIAEAGVCSRRAAEALIAQGEVVVVNDKFGIRLTDIATPHERLNKLR